MADRGAAVARALRAAGCVFAEDEARLIIEVAESPSQMAEMVDRRCAGEPLEQVVGFVEFCDLRIIVHPGVFVPRQRTARLVAEAIGVTGAGDVVVDLCCGTGAVGAAVHASVPGIELYATDIDPAAVRCARVNLGPLGATVTQGDLMDALDSSLAGRVATLVVNAPYVPTEAIALLPPEARDHEPHLALDGGCDGVDVHRRVAAAAGWWLRPDGHVLVETSEAQEKLTVEAFELGGLVTTAVRSGDLGTSIVLGSPGVGA